MSRDGRSIAYVSNSGDSLSLTIRDIAGGPPLTIAVLDAIVTLQWSYDGSALVFTGRHAGIEGTFTIPRLGGAPRQIAPRGWARLSHDGKWLARWYNTAPRPLIFVHDLETGAVDTVIVGPEERARVIEADWSPTGERLAVTTTSSSGSGILWILTAEGTRQSRVHQGPFSMPRWSPAGDAVYYMMAAGASELQRLRISRPDETAVGSPVTLLTGISAITGYWAQSGSLSITDDGGRLAYVRVNSRSNLWSLDLPQDTAASSQRLTSEMFNLLI